MDKRRHTWRHATHRLLVATLVAAGCVTVAEPARAAPAEAGVPGGFASWDALYDEQLRLNAGADRIVAEAKRSDDNGYAGIVAEPESRQLVLYWRGTMPASVRAVVDDVAKTLPVAVKPARYSAGEMAAAQRRLQSTLDAKTTRVTEIAPNVDGSGLTAKVIGGRAELAAQSALASSPVAVTVKSTGGRPVNTSRLNDSAPYYGGARWGIANNTPFCTTGWPVWRDGRTMMLTAAHCTSSGVQAYDGGNDYMGVTRDRWPGLDSMLIDVSSGPYMFDGDIYSNWTKPVVGVTSLYYGSWVCTSGAKSGVICNMRITLTGAGYTSGGVWVYPSYRATKNGTGAVSGQGDSGGPVFSLAVNQSQVLAAGIITAGEWGTNTTCVGEQGRTCYSATYFVHVWDSGDVIGFSIRTL
jgi:hypothetical protein